MTQILQPLMHRLSTKKKDDKEGKLHQSVGGGVVQCNKKHCVKYLVPGQVLV